MAGAMAGTALISAPISAESLDTITLTINNTCNLSCPHCYLQYASASKSFFIENETIESLLAASPRHICIVGKEPLSDRRSIALTEYIVDRAHDHGITSSLITNGVRLGELAKKTIRQLSWIDVSLDGGKKSYDGYRGPHLDNILRGTRFVSDHSETPIRVLHTISRENVDFIDDMLAICEEIESEIVMFSPYRATRSFGTQSCMMLKPYEFIESLASAITAYAGDYIISLDRHYLSQFDINRLAFAEKAHRVFGDRLLLVDKDPICRGMIRVTYDGLVMSPFESIDTLQYDRAANLKSDTLIRHFDKLREVAAHCYT